MKTISSFLSDYKTGKLSPVDVLKKYLTESKKRNDELNAYITILEKEAIEEVERVTSFDKPLSGIPIAVKDNFCTKDIRTTAASKVLENFIPPYESTVTKKLKEAGAILLGKTNMDAWSHGSSTETSDFGPSKNPHDTTRIPGGSSGGSAVAVAAGLAPIAMGSETAGSIRQPTSLCGVVGLKPTYGRVSRYGLIAMGSSLDSPGPITKTVEDSARILQVLAGVDPYDATTSEKEVPDYLKEMKKREKYTIGVSEEYLAVVDTKTAALFEETIKVLEKLGHTIKKIKLIDPHNAISVYTIVQRAEVSSNLARMDGVRFGASRSSFGTEAKRRMMFGAFTLSSGYYDAYYTKAQKVRTLLIEDFKNAYKNVDIIAAPSTPSTAPKLGESERDPMYGENADILVEASSIAGITGINIPAGLIEDMPSGIQFMAPWFEEGRLFDLGYQFEQETESYNIKPKDFYELKF